MISPPPPFLKNHCLPFLTLPGAFIRCHGSALHMLCIVCKQLHVSQLGEPLCIPYNMCLSYQHTNCCLILCRFLYSQVHWLMWYYLIHSRLLRRVPPERPVTSTSYAHGTCDLPLTSRTMQQCLMDTTKRIPDEDAVIVVHTATRKTFSQLSKDVCEE